MLEFDETEGEYQHPNIVALPDGNFVIVFSLILDIPNQNIFIYARKYDSTATPINNEFRVS